MLMRMQNTEWRQGKMIINRRKQRNGVVLEHVAQKPTLRHVHMTAWRPACETSPNCRA